MSEPVRLLFVDDDPAMLQELLHRIDWEKHGYVVVGTAGSGSEALDRLATLQPQIIISDIRMPGLDGLELAEVVAGICPEMKIILLTSFNDFEYIRKALTVKAVEYLLKDAGSEEILEAVNKARAELHKEQEIQGFVEQGKTLLRANLITRLLRGTRIEENLEAEVQEVCSVFPGENFCVAVIIPGANAKNIPEPPQLIRFCEEYFADAGPIIPIVHYDRETELIFGFDQPGTGRSAEFSQLLQRLHEALYCKLQFPVHIGVGEVHESVVNWNISYQEALSALELNRITNNHGVLFFGHFGETKNSYRLNKIIDYLNANYYKSKLSLAEVSKEINICSSYISTLFKKYCQVNFSEYLVRIRMEKAIELFTTTDLMTYEVAAKVGYENPQYFSVLFKKFTGTSPTEFRKQTQQLAEPK